MPASGEVSLAHRLEGLGLSLPEPPLPLGSYVAATQAGSLLFLSGMLPIVKGRPSVTGRLGAEVSMEAGRDAARLAGLNALSVAARAAGGLHRVRRALRIGVTMRAVPDFREHAAVADGVSELFAALFDAGHARLASGADALPLGVPVLLEAIFEIESEP